MNETVATVTSYRFMNQSIITSQSWCSTSGCLDNLDPMDPAIASFVTTTWSLIFSRVNATASSYVVSVATLFGSVRQCMTICTGTWVLFMIEEQGWDAFGCGLCIVAKHFVIVKDKEFIIWNHIVLKNKMWGWAQLNHEQVMVNSLFCMLIGQTIEIEFIKCQNASNDSIANDCQMLQRHCSESLYPKAKPTHIHLPPL